MNMIDFLYHILVLVAGMLMAMVINLLGFTNDTALIMGSLVILYGLLIYDISYDKGGNLNKNGNDKG